MEIRRVKSTSKRLRSFSLPTEQKNKGPSPRTNPMKRYFYKKAKILAEKWFDLQNKPIGNFFNILNFTGLKNRNRKFFSISAYLIDQEIKR